MRMNSEKEYKINFLPRFYNGILNETINQFRVPVIGFSENYKPFQVGDFLTWEYHKCKHEPLKRIRLIIKDTRLEKLQDISDSDLSMSGFLSKDDFFKTWDRIYPIKYNSKRQPDVWRFQFCRIKPIPIYFIPRIISGEFLYTPYYSQTSTESNIGLFYESEKTFFYSKGTLNGKKGKKK